MYNGLETATFALKLKKKPKMRSKNEVWAMIPARSGSKVIKNKNLINLRGKPLIAHSIIVANKSKKNFQNYFFFRF